jgi:hypothetical protein
MQITSKHIRPGVKGYALTITLIFLAVVLTIFASILNWTSSNAKVTLRNNQYNMSQAAAEAAVERVIGQMDRDFINLSILNSSNYSSLPAGIDLSTWPVQYAFSGTNGVANQITVNIGPPATNTIALNSQYSGLYGLAQSIDVIATATPIGQPQNVPATVHESLQLAFIPLYQFAIFYNVNLEIAPGAPMIISGPVFCNQSIWEGANNATFSSTVTAVGTNCSLKLDPFASNYGPQTPPAVFSMAGQPVDHANALVMPIGTNNNPATILGLLGLPPPAYAMGTADAYSSNGMVYPANGADLVISNASFGTHFGSTPKGTNTIIYFQDSSLVAIPFDFYIITNGNNNKIYNTNYVSPITLGPKTNIYYAGYSFVTNVVFGDWREGWNNGSGPAKTVQAVQIDIGLLNKWLTNTIVPGSASGAALDTTKVGHSGHHICSVYVYNYVLPTTTTLPAVRVFNGKQLPDPGTTPPKRAGLTVATPFPMYVQGDYNSQDSSGSALGLPNTLHTLPAALMADSITILSDSWNDSITTTLPTPTSTTVNAAMLEGIVASNPNISGNYSGGVENFLRLLENWNSTTTLTYNGSIVVLFYSQYATNTWLQTANYYNPPKRNWAFDLNFMQSAKLPPLTPSIKAMIRGQWTPQ